MEDFENLTQNLTDSFWLFDLFNQVLNGLLLFILSNFAKSLYWFRELRTFFQVPKRRARNSNVWKFMTVRDGTNLDLDYEYCLKHESSPWNFDKTLGFIEI